MKSRSDLPSIQVRLTEAGSFEPVSIYDAEALMEFSAGQVFDLKIVSKRSEPHHRLYWSVLSNAVKSTGKWATAEHLHHELKLACGYYKAVVSEFGGLYYVPDSIAFEKMDQHEFKKFFDHAMMKLSEAIGYDPIGQMDER